MKAVTDNLKRYTFVTVAYRDDYGLTRLQARSLGKYLDPRLAAEILIIENSSSGIPNDWQESLQSEYRSLAGKVKILDAREITHIPEKMSGWFSQQILKLMVSTVVSTDQYVILDGKNHLVHTLGRDFFETPLGLIRSYLMSYENHPMRPFFENSLSYFGLNPNEYLNNFMPTTTPFVLPTRLVRDLVHTVKIREGRPFPEAFVHGGYNKSEFFLFASYVLSLGKPLTDFYEFSGQRPPAIWPESSPSDCTAAIVDSEQRAAPFFAVHRRIFSKLSEDTRGEIAAFWHRHELFESLEQAEEFLLNP